LVITGAADASSDAVRDAVVSLGLGLRRLQRRTASLEDVFLTFADAQT
ncbi:MAG: ABC transporter ATP-binding protein, partial [Acidimicrobiia bacterium]|nr:ABC transporter ATP-binding protein [Acidimicrobiia bacterium]